jgi:hypothetical protein
MASLEEISRQLSEMKEGMVDLVDATVKVLSEVRDSLHENTRNRFLEIAESTGV